MKTDHVESFLISARASAYVADGGRVKALLTGSTQLEYQEKDWLYRDVYYTGINTFYGIETVFYLDKPVFGMSYYGNWGDMTEIEIDDILRGALVSNPGTRLYKFVEWRKGSCVYICEPKTTDSIREIMGTEKIIRKGKQIYAFHYAGSMLV